MSAARTDGFKVLGLGAAACVACCAAPIVAFIGGIGLAGVASTFFIGAAGLLMATVAIAAALLVRRRGRRTSCSVPDGSSTHVELSPRKVPAR